MSNTKNTCKMTIRLSPLTEFRLDRDYRLDGSRSKNEFIKKAVVRALDFLEAEQNETLPAAISSAIDGRLGMFEDRMAKLLFKQTVELDMGLTALLDCVNTDPDYIHDLRADSVRNVKATNGRLTFEQKARKQYDEGGDGEWRD